MEIAWVTSFPAKLRSVSGKPLIKSYVTHKVCGHMFAAVEGGITGLPAHPERVTYLDLDQDAFLQNWLKRETSRIPRVLGGQHPGKCECPGGPLDPHSTKHKMPCLGQWFNHHASRWFRKVAALAAVGRSLGDQCPILIWIDADCSFRRTVSAAVARSWFRDAAVFYHKNRRPVLEAGVVGYWLARGADRILRRVVDLYANGGYASLPRWDDSYVLQAAMAETPKIRTVDLASRKGPHAAVIPYGPLGPFITHDKGRHGRKLGIFK